MQKLFLGFLCAFMLFSCQEDDVCIDEYSPNLVFKIYSQDTQEPLFLENLYVTYRISDTEQDTLSFFNIDSAQIPLRIDNGPIGFGFYLNFDSGEKDSIYMNYVPNTEYVSKACGLKKIYQNVEYQHIQTDNIVAIQSLTPSITNHNEVHLILYY